MPAHDSQLVRGLTLTSSTALVIGSIIGTGVFFKAAIMSQQVGSPALVLAAWLVAGLLSLAGALTYAELGAMLPHAGGEYLYVRTAYGDMAGFLNGWMRFVVGSAGTAALGVSYGVFYNVNMWNNFQVMDVNPPFLISINQLNTPGNPVVTMANANQTATLSGTTKPEVLGVPQDYGLANSQQWTLTVQRALPANILLEVDYVGSKSTHFDRPAEYNLINVLAGQTARPLPQWGDIEFINTDASGTYEGLITKVEKRTSQGLTFLATYTFSKTMFDSFAGNGANRLSNPFDAKSEKGLAETDQRHRVTTSVLYELPLFRAQKGIVGHVLGGWQANGVFTFETGLPMYPLQPTEPIADGCPRCNPRPDRLANGNLPSDQRSLQRWFDTSAFKIATGHYGTSGRNILTAPGLTNLDFSLFKNIRVTENKRFQFRWEMYNATNTPPFNFPGLTIGTGTFGQVTSAGLGRVMQFGLRYEF